MTLPIEKAQIAKTTEQWTSLNPVLDLDVIGIEVKTNGYNRYKRGDGSTTWNSLSYIDKVYSDQGVTSVNNKTGAVTLTKSDIGLGSVDNTADENKNVLSAAKLKTAHRINTVPFDGTVDITVTEKITNNELEDMLL